MHQGVLSGDEHASHNVAWREAEGQLLVRGWAGNSRVTAKTRPGRVAEMLHCCYVDDCSNRKG
jgi:hypothetical protein